MMIRACAVLLCVAVATTVAEDIAIVDVADQWTQIAAVGPSLDAMGLPFDDLTADVEGGSLTLSGHALLIISSMTTNNAAVHQGLDDNTQAIQDFVDGGGIVIESTQADQNEANVDWLPAGLVAVRSDPDSPEFTIEQPAHPLFSDPNAMTDAEFAGWGHQGWPTVWEVFATLDGFDILATSAGRPVIGEAEFGGGMFVMMCIAPDKYSQVGNDDNTKEMATLFFENMVTTYFLSVTPDVSPEGLATTTWGDLRLR
ncbi:hypothetical protein CMK11_06395 [Candidatus Poribacteria bacterium]|nr:hypothetical protein [Candidatus Poribacteria bacterium]